MRISRYALSIMLISVCGAMLVLAVPVTGHAAAKKPVSIVDDPIGKGLVDDLQRATNGSLRLGVHAKTGKLRFIGSDFAHGVSPGLKAGAQGGPEGAARGFLAQYGMLFGVNNQARELETVKTKRADSRRSFVRFRQVHHGIPVLGGEMVVQTDYRDKIISANGEILPDPTVDTSPSVSGATARGTAVAMVAKEYGRLYGIDGASLSTSTPELCIYNPQLLGINQNITRLRVEGRRHVDRAASHSGTGTG